MNFVVTLRDINGTELATAPPLPADWFPTAVGGSTTAVLELRPELANGRLRVINPVTVHIEAIE